MKRGFTLLELACVIAVIGVITAAAIPAYDLLVRRARAAEAPSTLSAIAHAELRHYRDTRSYLPCAPPGEVPTGVGSFPNAEACWKELGIQVGGPVRYHYGVTLSEGSFLATAEGDLDRDGVVARFVLDGRDLSITVDDELE